MMVTVLMAFAMPRARVRRARGEWKGLRNFRDLFFWDLQPQQPAAAPVASEELDNVR